MPSGLSIHVFCLVSWHKNGMLAQNSPTQTTWLAIVGGFTVKHHCLLSLVGIVSNPHLPGSYFIVAVRRGGEKHIGTTIIGTLLVGSFQWKNIPKENKENKAGAGLHHDSLEIRL